MLLAKTVECGLRDRVFSLPEPGDGRAFHGILLTTGTGRLRTSDSDMRFSAPALVWTPAHSEQSLSIAAGSEGQIISVTDQRIAGAIGHSAEAVELRLLTARMIQVAMDAPGAPLADARHAFDFVMREAAQNRPGADSLIEAQLKTVLVILWRAALQHYRQLVETHFRTRRTIADYAGEIGISTDRLHDICSRNLDKSPRQLLHERVVHEARLMLENTNLSVDQIAAALGFRDSAYFNRFFRKKTGTPPSTYRREQLLRASSAETRPATTFADWP